MSRSLGHVVLAGARILLEKPDNWIQRTEHEGHRFCFDGAIIHAARTSTCSRKGQRAAAHAARLLVYRTMGWRRRKDIWNWNDKDGRTHSEVVATMDRALAA